MVPSGNKGAIFHYSEKIHFLVIIENSNRVIATHENIAFFDYAWRIMILQHLTNAIKSSQIFIYCWYNRNNKFTNISYV